MMVLRMLISHGAKPVMHRARIFLIAPLIVGATFLQIVRLGNFTPSFEIARAEPTSRPSASYFVAVRRADLSWTSWDSTKSKSFLKGFWLWKQAWDDSTKKVDTSTPDRNFQARLKAFSAESDVGDILLVVSGSNISSIDLNFKETPDGSSADIFTLDMCTDCGSHVFSESPGFVYFLLYSRPNLMKQIELYTTRDMKRLEGKLGKSEHSGTFALHVVDQSKTHFILPIATASWYVNHVPDGHWSPYRPEWSFQVQPIVE
jgi:hypothetical protein